MKHGALSRYQSSSVNHIMLDLFLRVALRETWLFIGYTDRNIHRLIRMHIYGYIQVFGLVIVKSSVSHQSCQSICSMIPLIRTHLRMDYSSLLDSVMM